MDETRIILLVERAQAGDRNAFGELVAHFEPTVFAIVMRRLRNRSEAVEVAQDVFIQAMRKIDQLREPVRFAGWLRQIAVRMSINRAVRRPHEAVSDPEVFGGVTGHEEAPLERAIESERAANLRDGIAKLKELDRQTLIAFYFEGQSLQEMSDAFESPVGTIKRRLHTARNRLKAELGELLPA
ncbi:RNA polymerase sigma factor [Stratiformator vulcanicus]|uniref:ECF RNA polymerase sigma factor SigW n=1 Tax=Stratiformator vulcanicus TaxID=2527980 RepID=A0A517R1M3_9PLAN|nr:sigma-70 family RNA polymerase sigma factor [Stratiformator vulcanicus]QDT37799.1 ECF RNA polymerase sigma factor SigW [Stratiformator vulcanicus]